MGWKRACLPISATFHATLSENQCGMETRMDSSCILVLNTVEREPMWDGNPLMRNWSYGFVRVEREPMWDGNL